jgi:quinohemoprotein ethanol dehydrogenase
MKRFAPLALVLVLAMVPGAAQGQQAPRPTGADLWQTPGRDWVTNGGSLKNQRYSSLSQITRENVGGLKAAWMTRLGSGHGTKFRFEVDPIVVDGVMYVATGNDDIFALDAVTGRKRWEWFSDLDQSIQTVCCGWDNRGVAVGEGKVFSGLLDGTFVALDQATGRVAWRTQVADWREGYTITAAPRYWEGLVYTGLSGAEFGVRGRVTALDAATGREVWRFYTTPGPGEVGAETWPTNDPDPVKQEAYLKGGATVWNTVALDPELGMLYFSTGNCGPDYDGSVRPGDNLFCASIVALDARTGQHRWHFQEVHHDIWDYDSPSPVVLFEQTYNGVERKGVYQAGKTGWLYFLDRMSGEPLIGIEERPVPQDARNATAPTQPYPVGDAFVQQCGEEAAGYLTACIFAPFWDIPINMKPGPLGGSNWAPTSYSPQTGYVYVSGNERTYGFATRPQEYTPGQRYTASRLVQPLGSTIGWTWTAMDSRTNRIVWQKTGLGGEHPFGSVVTASNLVFVGFPDGNMRAYDAATGDELWKFQTGWPIGAPPMTYEVNGTQYVAVAAGSNIRNGPGDVLDGDAIYAFSLNGTVDENTWTRPAAPTKVEFAGVIQDAGAEGLPAQVAMDEYSFAPNRIRVPVGSSVVWNNRGGLVHTATETNYAWNTGDVVPGGQASVQFNAAGTWTYFCEPHPWMLGQVIVE